MRERVYVPDRIKNPDTETAVAILSYWLKFCGVCEYDDAKERICRLLGWMCEKAGGNDEASGRMPEIKRVCAARIYAPLVYHNDDLSAPKDWWHWSKTFSCGHVIEGEGPSDMMLPEVCPICEGKAAGKEG